MQIQKRSIAAIYRLIITILVVAGFWIELTSFQADAWRLFATWVLLALAIYYLIITVKTTFFRKSPANVLICPMLQGMFLVATISMLIASMNGWQLTGITGFGNVLIVFIIPLLLLGDYFIFTKKGSWRTIEPFYWLAPPIIYVAYIIITGDFRYGEAGLIYPYTFLDFHVIGVDRMLWYFALEITIILIIGYVLVAIDYFASGEVAQHVVMPRIKTIVVEEEIPEATPISKVTPKKSEPKKPTTQKPESMQSKPKKSEPTKAEVRKIDPVKSTKPQPAPKKSSVKSQTTKSSNNKSGNTKPNVKNQLTSAPKRARNSKASAPKPEKKS